MHITKKCDQQCPISTYTRIAISSCTEDCTDSTDYSKVCNLQPEKDFKDFCRSSTFQDGKDCLMANNSNIAYQQCYTGDYDFLRYYFDRKLCFHVVFSQK